MRQVELMIIAVAGQLAELGDGIGAVATYCR